jgi:hypothetical protein
VDQVPGRGHCVLSRPRLCIEGVPQEGQLVDVEDGGVFGITCVFDFPTGLDKEPIYSWYERLEDGEVVLETSWFPTFR